MGYRQSAAALDRAPEPKRTDRLQRDRARQLGGSAQGATGCTFSCARRSRILSLLRVLLFAIIASNSDLTKADPLIFLPEQPFDAGSGPGGVCAADFNGDGKIDVAVSNSNAETVSVLLNATALESAVVSFDSRVSFMVGASPASLSTADVNDDGNPDLIAANHTDDTVSVLLNTAVAEAEVPSFAPQQVFETGQHPVSSRTTDINGDGRFDVAVANYEDSTLSILLNLTVPGTKAARFAGQKIFATGANPFSLATADVNADGRPDLLTANLYGDSVSVLINTTPTGTMALGFAPQVAFASGRFPTAIATADFNGDGLRDIVVSNYPVDTVSVLLNDTAPGAITPAFKPRMVLAAGYRPKAVAADDVSRDGSPDILVANFLGNTLSALVNDTAPGSTSVEFAEQQHFPTGIAPEALIATDVNGDGDLDPVSANYVDGTISVLINATRRGDSVFANGFEL